MKNTEPSDRVQELLRLAGWLSALAVLICLLLVVSWIAFFGGIRFAPSIQQAESKAIPSTVPVIVNGKDSLTGLIADTGWEVVKANCTSCHTSKLITSNRMTAEGWLRTIRWMQEKQNLWDLGENEKIIIDYLAKNYAPQNTGRRKKLSPDWYLLK